MSSEQQAVKFETPDGTRYATPIDGARLIGDAPPSAATIDAVRELIAVAEKRFEMDETVKGAVQPATPGT